jgi:RND family efflux transporter MFP subunit
VTLTGTVQAQTEVNLSFRVDGRMIERSAQVGDTVRAGQVIARLDPQNEESSLQAAKAQSSAAQARLVEARNNFARMKDLITDNSVSRAQYDQAESMLRTAESGLETAQSQVTPRAEPPELHDAGLRGRGGRDASRPRARRGRGRGAHDRAGRA